VDHNALVELCRLISSAARFDSSVVHQLALGPNGRARPSQAPRVGQREFFSGVFG